MTYENVALSLPSGLVGTLQMMAIERDELLNDLVRGMLDREAMRLRSARAIVQARENRLSRLRHLLAPDMLRATDWADLQSRLALYGVVLRDDGGRLTLHDLITRERMCTSTDLGFSYPDFTCRFGRSLPEGPCVVSAA